MICHHVRSPQVIGVFVTDTGTTEDRVDLLLIDVLTNVLLLVIHDIDDIAHLLVYTSACGGMVVNLEDIAS